MVIPHVYNGHDKTFFFFAYEEYHNTQTNNNGTITVPTTAYLAGNLSSNILGPIKDSNGNPVVDCLGRQLYNGEVFDPSTTRTVTCTGGPTGAGSTGVVRDGFGTGRERKRRAHQLAPRAQHMGSGSAGYSSYFRRFNALSLYMPTPVRSHGRAR